MLRILGDNSRSTLASTATHVALVLAEPATLVWWFLYTCGVHKMERTLVLLVIVGVLARAAMLGHVLVCNTQFRKGILDIVETNVSF